MLCSCSSQGQSESMLDEKEKDGDGDKWAKEIEIWIRHWERAYKTVQNKVIPEFNKKREIRSKK